jgi:hypothetical protein
MQAVPIATEVVSSNPVHGDVYSVQHYVIKFVRLATGRLVFFLRTPVFSSNKTDRHGTRRVFGHLEPGRTLRTGSDK